MPRFLKILARNLLKGPATEAFPFKEAHTPARFRGRVALNPDLCVGCGICRHVCPGGAIHMEADEERTGYNFLVWHNSCCLCGSCRHYCPTGAIALTNNWHGAHYQADKYVQAEHHFVPYLHCSACGAPIRMLPPEVATRVYANNAAQVADLIRLCPACRRIATVNREGARHESRHDHE
jgi:formate hydrogenlyase subunit 6/NADH:ubiquinone oxidoreductase subunit I